MSTAMPLAELQRGFCDWLVDAPTDFARRIGDRAAEGLKVYQNNYRSQLVACLGETFEHLHAWLGDEAFADAARAHIQRNPPYGWTLGIFGEGFDRTLATLYPDDPEVAELAWLEWSLAQAFTGPDAEGVAPVELTGIDWDTARLICAPTMRMRAATTNAGAIWSALSAGEAPPAAALLPERGAMLVWRNQLTPCFRTIEADEQKALERIAAGTGFGEMCAQLAAQAGEAGIQLAGIMLGQWLRDRVVIGVLPPA
jgi:hypothetical protein